MPEPINNNSAPGANGGTATVVTTPPPVVVAGEKPTTGITPPAATTPPAAQPNATGTGIELFGQKFENLAHAERVLGDRLSALNAAETKLKAIEMAETERKNEQILFDQTKVQNPSMTDEQIRDLVKTTQNLTQTMLKGQQQRFEQVIGQNELHTFLTQQQVPGELAEQVRNVYAIPEIAYLVNARDANGQSVLSFGDLKDWAEAPVLRTKVQQLEHEIASLKNGTLGATQLGNGGGTNPAGGQLNADLPPKDWKALKDWKAARGIR